MKMMQSIPTMIQIRDRFGEPLLIDPTKIIAIQKTNNSFYNVESVTIHIPSGSIEVITTYKDLVAALYHIGYEAE